MVYAKGFILQYAEYVGLNGEDLLRKHIQLLAPLSKQGGPTYRGVSSLEYRSNGMGGREEGRGNFLFIAALVVLITLACIVAKYLQLI